jgi:hypothetical protein
VAGPGVLEVAWLTLVAALAAGADRERRVAERLQAAGGVLAQARLLDVGAGEGAVWVSSREAWKEAQETEETGVRAFRVWDAIVDDAQPGGSAYVSLAADLSGPGLDFDDPTVAGALRSTLASFLPLLGTGFIAISTLMSDWMHCSGALTVFRAGSDREASTLAAGDPWRAVAPVRLYRLEPLVFRALAPPPGPNTQRYGASNPWPGDSFGG